MTINNKHMPRPKLEPMPQSKRELNMTIESGKTLKRDCLKAVKEKKETFIFQDQEILTNYAKYLIEYLENSVFKQKL